ncbi:MAG: alcohol dehydrogenase catalytic domain-containing protein [Oscillospiraceae bacterium]
MRAIVLHGANDFRLEDTAKTKCPEGGVLLKVSIVGLCGSDLRKLRSGAHHHPVILGHEIVGIVAESQCEKYKVGERVMPCIAAVCGECFFCKNGMECMCSDIKVQALGYDPRPDYQGGFAEYMPISRDLAERGKLYRLPDDMTDEEAVMIEPYTNIFHSHDVLPLSECKNAIIIGAGPVGAMNVEVLQQLGIRCVVDDINAERIEMLRQVVEPDASVCPLNEDLYEFTKKYTNGMGFDLAILACSSPAAYTQSLELLRPNGHALFFSGLPDEQEMVALNVNLIHYKQLSIHGAYGANLADFDKSFDMIREKKLNAAAYANPMAFEDFANAVVMMEQGKVMKPVFRP